MGLLQPSLIKILAVILTYLEEGTLGSVSFVNTGKILTQIPPSSGASRSYCKPHWPSPILGKIKKFHGCIKEVKNCVIQPDFSSSLPLPWLLKSRRLKIEVLILWSKTKWKTRCVIKKSWKLRLTALIFFWHLVKSIHGETNSNLDLKSSASVKKSCWKSETTLSAIHS